MELTTNTIGQLGHVYAQLGSFVLGGTDDDNASTVPSSSSSTTKEFRLYSPTDGVFKRTFFPETWIDQLDFEIEERGGCGKGTAHALVTWEEMTLVGGERMDVYLFGTLVYRGFVRIPHISVGSRQEARIQFGGHMETVSYYQAHCRYAYGAPVDLSVIAAEIINDHVKVAGRLPDLVLDMQMIGVTADRFDSTGKDVAQALNALCDLAPGQAIWGFDVDESGNDRAYIRPKSTAITHRYSIGGNAVSFDYPKDLSEIVNRLYLKGGKVIQPNLLTDGSFENPLPNSETNGNLLGDYSFEAGSGGATLGGGATRKGPGDHGGARTGSYWAELDSNGESATWTEPVDHSIPLVASFWARREDNAIARQVRGVVDGLDAGNNVVVTYYVPSAGYSDPGSDIYVRYQNDEIDFTSYPTVTQARVKIETNGGTSSDDGIDVDDVALYERAGSPGAWTYTLAGSATRAQLNWMQRTLPNGDTEPFHGCYCVLVEAANISTGSDYLEIVTADTSRISVRPNNPYTFIVFLRGANLSDAYSVELVIREYDSSNTLQHTNVGSAVTATSIAWTATQYAVQTAPDTATISVAVRIINNNPVYIDAAFLAYGTAPAELFGTNGAGGYWEGDTYERVCDVENASLSGLSADALTSIATYGEHEQAVEVNSVVDWETAKPYFSDYFNAHASPSTRASLQVWPTSADELLTCDGKVKVLNLPDRIDGLFPSRIQYSISNQVEFTAELGDNREDVSDLLKVTEERAKRGL